MIVIVTAIYIIWEWHFDKVEHILHFKFKNFIIFYY